MFKYCKDVHAIFLQAHYNSFRFLLKSSEEDFKETKGAIRIRISKKNRQHNGQTKKYKGETTIYKHTYKTKETNKYDH